MRDCRRGGLWGGHANGAVDLDSALRVTDAVRQKKVVSAALFSDRLHHIGKWDVPRIVYCLQQLASSNVIGVDHLGQQFGRRPTRQIDGYPDPVPDPADLASKIRYRIRLEKPDPVHP
jgi:hypothetical protein